uniref:Arrestin_C domain-containing protein n=1 Tax=Schistocephalus solidus TaxID=70667 RepID=A0A0X3NGD9_SCHSO
MEARFYTGLSKPFGIFDDMSQGSRVAPYSGCTKQSRGFTSEVFMPPSGCCVSMDAGVVTGSTNWGSSLGKEEHFESGNTSTPKEGRFSCYELSGGYGSHEGTMIDAFGVANKYLHQFTLKVFNPRVIPDKILYGITYFDTKEQMKVNRIRIKGNGTMLKQINKKKDSGSTEVPTNTFTREVVTSGFSGTRNQNNYHAQTRDFTGNDVYQRLNLPLDLYDGDENLLPFNGPITLSAGTHAIPFAVRIPATTNPTILYKRNHKKIGSATVQLLYTVFAEVDVQASPSGNNATIVGEKVPIQILSCAGLPPVVANQYLPGDVQIIPLPYKSSKVLLITEKKHLQSPDTIRLYVYTDNSRAVHSVFCELIQSSNLPEIELSDDQDVENPKKEPGLELLYRTKKVALKKDFPKRFTSKVGERFPPDMENYAQNAINPNLDDRAKMPETSRKAGCLVEIPVPAGLDPNIEAGDTRIRYHIRIHLDVKGQRKPESPAELLTISEELLHNYKIKYVVFTDQ